ncbi:MAG: methyltransferase type 11 [Rhodospirillaceae bacterium]|nr:methyltransferase type 11 [Rhodospirillaceae bacterium]
MSAHRPHPMMPESGHDEISEQLAIVDMKLFLFTKVDPNQRSLLEDKIIPNFKAREGREPRNHQELRKDMEKEVSYQAWLTMNLVSQDMMWDAVGTCVDRQIDELKEKAVISNPSGSVRTNPDFTVPNYIEAQDIHRMPGNYHSTFGPDDVRQGAVFDRGAVVYQLGRNGGYMNDIRGHTIISHYLSRWPKAKPLRILDMGCTVGHSTLAIAGYFPDAETHAIDVGAGMLRYAHARAERLNIAVHFSQQNAEKTDFEDNSFDLITSSAVLHETSGVALPNIVRECHRLLKPGGAMVHLEVPSRLDDLDTWGKIRGDYEIQYNYEPFWKGALTADWGKLASDSGFSDVAVGYQDATANAERGNTQFGGPSKGVHRSWLMISGIK